MRKIMGVATTLFLVAGCTTASVESGAPLPPSRDGDVLETGSTLTVELNETLSVEDNNVGDEFTASVKDAVLDEDGRVLVPEGATVHGEITGIAEPGEESDQAAIRLHFESMTVNGEDRPFSAEIVDTDVSPEDLARIDDVQRNVAVGAAAGAVLGAVLGGSVREALIGGVLGAGAGTVLSLGTGEFEAALPEGMDMTLRTTTRVAVES